MNSIFKQAYRSFELDYQFLKTPIWTARRKLRFLLTKYRVKFRRFNQPFELGKDSALIDGSKIFYDSQYGLSGYQSVLVREYALLRIGKMTNIKTVIDVGANVGYFYSVIKELFPTSRVYCIEPIKEVFACLQQNFGDDTDLTLSNVGMSDKKGTLRMSFDPKETVFSKVSEAGGVEVEVTTLDEYIQMNGIREIDLLKIDTETFESNILQGGQQALSLTRYLYIETTFADNSNYTLASLMSLLVGPGMDYQLVAYRNFDNSSMGRVRAFDCLMENTMYKVDTS